MEPLDNAYQYVCTWRVKRVLDGLSIYCFISLLKRFSSCLLVHLEKDFSEIVVVLLFLDTQIIYWTWRKTAKIEVWTESWRKRTSGTQAGKTLSRGNRKCFHVWESVRLLPFISAKMSKHSCDSIGEHGVPACTFIRRALIWLKHESYSR